MGGGLNLYEGRIKSFGKVEGMLLYKITIIYFTRMYLPLLFQCTPSLRYASTQLFSPTWPSIQQPLWILVSAPSSSMFQQMEV